MGDSYSPFIPKLSEYEETLEIDLLRYVDSFEHYPESVIEGIFPLSLGSDAIKSRSTLTLSRINSCNY